MNNWKMLTGGLVAFAVLTAGIYIYAESCGSHDKTSGSGKSCGSGDKCDHSGKAGQKGEAKTPENLIKQADKLLNEIDKAKNVKPLMAHCQEMMSASLTMMTECNRALKGEKPDMAKMAGTIDTANQLMKKSAELTDKCLSLMPKPACAVGTADRPEKVEEKGEAKTLPARPDVLSGGYVCPMGCVEPQAEPGRCPKCGMNLEKKK